MACIVPEPQHSLLQKGAASVTVQLHTELVHDAVLATGLRTGHVGSYIHFWSERALPSF